MVGISFLLSELFSKFRLETLPGVQVFTESSNAPVEKNLLFLILEAGSMSCRLLYGIFSVFPSTMRTACFLMA